MANSGKLTTRAEVLKRRRRDRQIAVFGILAVALVVLTFSAMGIYRGTFASPFEQPFITPSPDVTDVVTLACPPSGEASMPMPANEISFRTLNGAGESGLARAYLEDLRGRGFVGVAATNSNRPYDGLVQIVFGKAGLRQAYTIALQFPESELVYDNRSSALVDLILGKDAVSAELRPLYAPELDPSLELTETGRCLPIDLLQPQPAPARLPADPLAVVEEEPVEEGAEAPVE